MAKKLTPKQKIFVEEYAKTKNGVKAALVAYPKQSYGTASVTAQENLKKDVVARTLEEIESNPDVDATLIIQKNSKWYISDEERATLFWKYIYLLKTGTYYKIGISQNVGRRIKQIKNASPYETEIVTSAKVENAELLEKQLHARYAEYYIRGEWFELPIDIANALIIEIKGLNNGNN
jgi:hypothetical protein